MWHRLLFKIAKLCIGNTCETKIAMGLKPIAIFRF
jgi:hypothetical protein